jgi:hypothetical protein
VLALTADVEWMHELEPFENPFDLSITVAGYFTWDPGRFPSEDREAWLDYNGTYLLWPYLRAYTAMITGASSLPALTVYTMVVPEPPGIPEAAPESDEAGARKKSAPRKKGAPIAAAAATRPTKSRAAASRAPKSRKRLK